MKLMRSRRSHGNDLTLRCDWIPCAWRFRMAWQRLRLALLSMRRIQQAAVHMPTAVETSNASLACKPPAHTFSPYNFVFDWQIVLLHAHDKSVRLPAHDCSTRASTRTLKRMTPCAWNSYYAHENIPHLSGVCCPMQCASQSQCLQLHVCVGVKKPTNETESSRHHACGRQKMPSFPKACACLVSRRRTLHAEIFPGIRAWWHLYTHLISTALHRLLCVRRTFSHYSSVQRRPLGKEESTRCHPASM